ncbi:MAG TPA: AMP-binding protein, partial [Pedococcus sp.]|nr:AMP-binding protein [Pedococcus sp.]
MYEHLHDHRRWVLPEVLEAQARQRGDQMFLTVIGEGSLTYAAAAREARQVAAHCAGLGVAAGDPVAVLLPNGLDFVRLWLGLGRLGAVIVPINTGLAGEFLAHQLRDSGARVVVSAGPASEAVADLLDEVDGLQVLDLDGWQHAPEYGGPLPAAADTACLMYTSGTTGPSKGVLMPHAHCYLFGLGSLDSLGITAADRYYVCMPLFHANGLFMQLYATLIAGASAVLRGRFSATSWLSDIREHGCTVTNLLGAMSQFVIAQPSTADDRDHS